ncbi:MAG: hypothetical protein MZV64_15230 [Ignavibacteriales bacterium]|nr:hypothetical protein [Ignavibacteriales bacterium]
MAPHLIVQLEHGRRDVVAHWLERLLAYAVAAAVLSLAGASAGGPGPGHAHARPRPCGGRAQHRAVDRHAGGPRRRPRGQAARPHARPAPRHHRGRGAGTRRVLGRRLSLRRASGQPGRVPGDRTAAFLYAWCPHREGPAGAALCPHRSPARPALGRRVRPARLPAGAGGS